MDTIPWLAEVLRLSTWYRSAGFPPFPLMAYFCTIIDDFYVLYITYQGTYVSFHSTNDHLTRYGGAAPPISAYQASDCTVTTYR